MESVDVVDVESDVVVDVSADETLRLNKYAINSGLRPALSSRALVDDDDVDESVLDELALLALVGGGGGAPVPPVLDVR